MQAVRPSAILAAFLAAGCATHHAISGSVVDRNGEPVERALVSVQPGNVAIVTDPNGWFQIDYLRDETGERTKLKRRTTYEIEIFKPGYHLQQVLVEYKRGELLLEPIVLKEDTIRVVGVDENIDPGAYPDRTQSSGATYEGE